MLRTVWCFAGSPPLCPGAAPPRSAWSRLRPGIALFLLLCGAAAPAQTSNPHTTAKSTHHQRRRTRSTKHHKPVKGRSHTHSRRRPRKVSARQLARAHQLHHAFVASSELRPMAQQLMLQRTPQAYAGVEHYAQTHSGEAAAAAYLALGQAYLLDGKFPQSASAFERSAQAGQALSDYADYLAAKALFAGQQYPAASDLVRNFAARHPDSILTAHASLLLAKIHLGEGDPQSALHDLSGASSLAAAAGFFSTS